MPTLLYVEDDQWRFASVTRILSLDFDVITARDADEAIIILQAHQKDPNMPPIDIILLDINMPVGKIITDPNKGQTSGVGFARVVLKQLQYDIPIICYTVHNNTRIYEELLDDIGVKAVISKTTSPMELRAMIHKYLQAD